jgi:hypothetical protein
MGFAAGEAGTVCWNHAKISTSSTAKVYSINPNCPFIERYSISMRLQRKPHNNITGVADNISDHHLHHEQQ